MLVPGSKPVVLELQNQYLKPLSLDAEWLETEPEPPGKPVLDDKAQLLVLTELMGQEEEGR